MRKLLAILTMSLIGCVTAHRAYPPVNCTHVQVRIFNTTTEWTDRDQVEYDEARTIGCTERFGSKSCLPQFHKLGYQQYTLVCGNR